MDRQDLNNSMCFCVVQQVIFHSLEVGYVNKCFIKSPVAHSWY